jgi:Bacterial type II and III secretion system protein
MKTNFGYLLRLTILFGLGFAGVTDSVRSQETPKERPDRRTVRPPTFAPQPQTQREPTAADDRGRRTATDDAPLTDSPQGPVLLTLWELTVSDSAKQPEADSKSNLAWQLQNLPMEFGSLQEVRDLITRIKDAGRLRSSREVRLVALDGQSARLQVGADKPQISGTNQTNMGRMNSITYRSVGTIIEVRTRIVTEKHIQVQLDYNASDMAKADDVALSESNDGTSKAASYVANRQLKTAAKLKNGGAAILQSDTISGSADKSVPGQTVLIILGGSIGTGAPAEK